MKEELEDFLRFCAIERRLAPLTCAAYERDVSVCLGYLQGAGVTDLAEVKPTHLRAFLAEESKRRPAPSSQARATAALKSFFRFLVEDEQLERDPARPLRTPKKREALPDVLTMAELERLLAAPARDDVWERSFAGKVERDRLLLALFAYGGLRRNELLGVDWDDVDLSRRLLRVRHAKGGRARVVPIHPALTPLFAAYYATRVPLTEQAVFVGVQGGRLNYTQLGQSFRRYVEASGVGERKRVTPHTLRHVFASELLRAGANLRQVQELLGHKHLDSTQRYTRVTAHELRGAIKRLRWVGQSTLTFDPAGALSVVMGRPNDQRFTPTSCQTPVTSCTRSDFVSARRHASAVVCIGLDPRLYVTVKLTPDRNDALDHCPPATTRERFATLPGAFQASRHARSEGRVAAAAVPASVSATTSAAS